MQNAKLKIAGVLRLAFSTVALLAAVVAKAQPWQPVQVIFPAAPFTGSMTNSVVLNVQPVPALNPQTDGSFLYGGAGTEFTCVGTITNPFVPGFYLLSSPGWARSVGFQVLETNTPQNVIGLMGTNIPTFTPAPFSPGYLYEWSTLSTNILLELGGGGGGGGAADSNTFIGQLNFGQIWPEPDAGGAAQQATNVFNGLAAYSHTNQFDAAGNGAAAAQAATNVFNGLAAYSNTNQFDGAGAGASAAQKATNVFNGLAAYSNTNQFDAAGAAQKTTNVFNGLAAYSSTNQFDAAGTGAAAAQAGTNVFNGLAAYSNTNQFDGAGAGTVAAQKSTNVFNGLAAYSNTNQFDGAGAAQKTTNVFNGLAAYSSTNQFDAAGAGTAAAQKDTNVFNGLAAYSNTNQFLASGPGGNHDGSGQTNYAGTNVVVRSLLMPAQTAAVQLWPGVTVRTVIETNASFTITDFVPMGGLSSAQLDIPNTNLTTLTVTISAPFTPYPVATNSLVIPSGQTGYIYADFDGVNTNLGAGL